MDNNDLQKLSFQEKLHCKWQFVGACAISNNDNMFLFSANSPNIGSFQDLFAISDGIQLTVITSTDHDYLMQLVEAAGFGETTKVGYEAMAKKLLNNIQHRFRTSWI